MEKLEKIRLVSILILSVLIIALIAIILINPDKDWQAIIIPFTALIGLLTLLVKYLVKGNKNK